MTTTFEQPKHLNVVDYQRLVRAFWPIFLFSGCVLSAAMMVFYLWSIAAAGGPIATWRWIVPASVGLVPACLFRVALLCERSRRRYVEFRGDRLFLAGHGTVSFRRFVSWSLTPDPLEPRYTRLQLVYRFGLGRKRWRMLLDDDSRIAELKDALAQIPGQDQA